ncbi:WASH complex subunit 5-like [Paramacrobiotus metropolitanus]|uniref:WASH complex subunit 5-like n=1 Tax=Paramacrobiotus metropolitanus TaxID=2943436 RepID=UPI0024460E3B|nr:WASH complex subunit 5-like [Paramacrobiotus metropolitanus]
MDFLADNNLCGQTVLRLVSRGNATIAELLRLSEYIPPIYRLDSRQEQLQYGEILLDFSYFKSVEMHERRIENTTGMQETDLELRDNYLDILRRFYVAFESVHRYATELNRFVEDLEDGIFIQQSMETVFMNSDGKQLMCEALYLYGVMLLIMDVKYEGTVRERLLVAYYRYCADTSRETNIDEVCTLLRSTGYSSAPTAKRPPNYPEDYFRRIKFKPQYISMVVGRLRSDDIYHRSLAFPLPEHRSTALSTQAAMLYVVLYFEPDTLHNQPAKMREIVDKHFADNWVIGTYMGMLVNLLDAWEPYKAARGALANTIDAAVVRNMAARKGEKLQKINQILQQLLKEGSLTEENAINNVSKLLNLVRDCNVTVRWLMLHTAPLTPALEINKKCKAMRDLVLVEMKCRPVDIFELLLNTAQFELKLKELYKLILAAKESKWTLYKSEAKERLTDLSDAFTGGKPLTRIEKNEKLQNWFAEMARQVDNLSFSELGLAGPRIIQLIQALEEVQAFHQLESNIQVRQFITETQQFLHKMIKMANTKEDILVNLEIVGDLSYAWQLIDSYTKQMQDGIKENPSLVIKLRATFLKMASAMDLPLLRINQANSNDLESVSQYYSGELVAYVRKVLHIIPETLFNLLAQIVNIQINRLKELPTRLDKDKLKDFAQLDERFEVARLTHAISVFTEGILQMKTTLVGIIKIDPKQLLEDGIRKELVRLVAQALHNDCIFAQKQKSNDFVQRLDILGVKMDGFRRSFEYIQDYVELYGLKIWQEETSRIINYNVEQECNTFLRNKVQDWESIYQSKTIPIPRFQPVDVSVTFVGRLARELIRITDPKVTVYIDQMTAWFDVKTRQELVNITIFRKLQHALGVPGLAGLDRLYSFMIVRELQSLQKILDDLLKERTWVAHYQGLSKMLGTGQNTIPQAVKFYAQATSKGAKIWPAMIETFQKIGQLQLLRRQLAYELRTVSRFDSKHLVNALEIVNEVVLTDFKTRRVDRMKDIPKEQSFLMYELSQYLQWTGLTEPLMQVYIGTRRDPYLGLAMFLTLLSTSGMFIPAGNLGNTLVPRRRYDPMDGTPFLVGFITVMKQFHGDYMRQVMQMLGQYLRSVIENAKNMGSSDFGPDAATLVVSVQWMLLLGAVDHEMVESYISGYVVRSLQTVS